MNKFQIYLQAEYILDLQKQLTLMSVEPKEDVNGGLSGENSVTSATPIDKVFLTCGFNNRGEPFCK